MLAKVFIPVRAYIRATHIAHHVAAGTRQLIASIRLDERDRAERTLQHSASRSPWGGEVNVAYRALHRVRHRALHKNTHAVLLLLIAAVKRGPFLPALDAALTPAAARTAKQHSATAALELLRCTVHARP